MSELTKDITPENVEDIFYERYAVYGAATIKNRAIPSVYDGLNPVSRRILTTFNDEGYSLKFSKAAMYVGSVLARYHPAGDMSVYETTIGLAQWFNKLNPFIDRQGNVGSVDDFKSFAAQRYVELRMSKFTNDIFFDEDYSKDYTPMVENYDGSRLEPKHLPAKFPVILNSGMLGIGSGFASEIPPHKVDDICKLTIKYIDNPNIKTKVLVKDFRPDFPMGGIITNSSELVSMYEKGKGVIQNEALIEEGVYNKHEVLYVKQLPYKISTSKILQEIQSIVTSKNPVESEKLSMIWDVKDLSGKNDPVSLVIIPKRGTSLSVLRNALLQHTSLRISVKYLPNVLIGNDLHENASIKTILEGWLSFRISILARKFKFLLKRNNEQIFLKSALIKAHDKVDELVKLIKSSKDKEDTITKVMDLLDIYRREATYIVSIQLYQLNRLEVSKLKQDIKDLEIRRKELITLLSDEANLKTYIKDQLQSLAKKYASERRTKLENTYTKDNDVRDLLEEEELVVAISSDNYVYTKPTDQLSNYKRGAKGNNFIPSKYHKTLKDFFIVNSHNDLLVFLDNGKYLSFKGYEFNVWHKPISTILKLSGVKVVNVIAMDNEDLDDKFLMFTTKLGKMKLVALEEFKMDRVMAKGNLATKILENDTLMDVRMVSEDMVFMAATSNGKAQKMVSSQVPIMKKPTYGFSKFTLSEDEYVTSVTSFNDEPLILAVASNGVSVKCELEDFPLRRGDKGMRSALKLIDLSTSGGKLVACLAVNEDSEVLATTTQGKSNKVNISDVRITKRGTKGVKLLSLNEGDNVTNVALV